MEKQRDDPRSMLSLYRRLIALRRAEPALSVGRLELVEAEGDVLAYMRRARRGEASFLVALNLGAAPQRLRHAGRGSIVLSTFMDDRKASVLELRPNEGIVLRLEE